MSTTTELGLVRVRPSGRYIHFHLYNKLLLSTTARAMLDPEAEEGDGQMETEGLY